MADLGDVEHGQRVLDVGCGPGALTAELARRVGSDHVAAIDPSESFVEAARERFPVATILQASAETCRSRTASSTPQSPSSSSTSWPIRSAG